MVAGRAGAFVSAFNKTMDRLHKYGRRLTEFNYNNKEIADEIYSAINSTQFLGISVSRLYRLVENEKMLKVEDYSTS